MKKGIKKSQIMITALALMIAVAGYLQFSGIKLNEETILNLEQDDMVTALGEETLGEEDDVVTMLDLSDEDLKMMEYTDVDSMDSEVELTPNYSDDEMATQIDMQTDAQNQAQTDTPGTTVSAVSPGVVSLNDAKILKEQTRAQNKASLMEIVNSAELSDSAKQAVISIE